MFAMRIEEEIKQRTFRSEFHKLAINILFTSNWLKSRETKIFKSYGISMQQYNVLRILRGQSPKPASLLLIRERMLDKESNASRLVDKLCIKGFTERIQCPNDRRQVEISITEKGLQILDDLDPLVDQIDSHMKSLSIGEAEQLNKLLDKIRD
jgi:DNA-binding MarR family transcriptional regulator